MNLWKLGTNWGTDADNFFDLLKKQNIVINDIGSNVSVQKGDLVAITEKYEVIGLARVTSYYRGPVTNNPQLKSLFKAYQIHYDDHVYYASAQIYKLSETDKFEYPMQKGISNIRKPAVIQRLKQLAKKLNV